MSLFTFRPWGMFEWILGRIKSRKWSYLGCYSVEERCLAAFEFLSGKGLIANYSFIKVCDPKSHFSEEVDRAFDRITELFINLGGDPDNVREEELFLKDFKLNESINAFIDECAGNIILDISSFPKKFFSPMLSCCLDRPK